MSTKVMSKQLEKFLFSSLENNESSEENQKTQPGFKPKFSSIWKVGFLILNNQ